MSMEMTTYIMTGFKTTYDEAREKWPDAFEEILTSEPEGIGMASTEDDCNDIIIGVVNHKMSEYSYVPEPRELQLFSHTIVDEKLRKIGINVGVGAIRNYVYATWG